METQELPARVVAAAFKTKRILVPVDFSPASSVAVEYARRISGITGADLIFLHVLVPDAPLGCEDFARVCPEELKHSANENLRTFVRAAARSTKERPKSVMRYGLPTHEIIEEARNCDADLIVIASHGYTGWKHFCIGSTAERVVRAAPCSVLVVRQKEHDFAQGTSI